MTQMTSINDNRETLAAKLKRLEDVKRAQCERLGLDSSVPWAEYIDFISPQYPGGHNFPHYIDMSGTLDLTLNKHFPTA